MVGRLSLVGDLDTPVALVDVTVLEANLSRMAGRIAGTDATHRPHSKTHKTREIAERQLAHGARGLTVAKLGEAEAFIEAGFEDLLIAYPLVGRTKLERLLGLLDRAAIRFTVDSVEGARGASEVLGPAGVTVDVLIELDAGIGRTGVPSVEDVLALAERVDAMPGLRVAGVLSFAAGYVEGAERQREVGAAEGEAVARAVAKLQGAGHQATIASCGSTPTSPHAASVLGVTEVRAGNYVFHDRMQVKLGVARPEDCALTILATVVSRPRDRRYVVDAGLKTFAGEDFGWGTYGEILGRPDVQVTFANEEHGVIVLADGVPDPGYAIGERVRIIPDHACGTANMHDELVAVEGERVIETWPLISRGRLR
jgi:D-serine deaminase-like pyridoxal phosphate-dependent protein